MIITRTAKKVFITHLSINSFIWDKIRMCLPSKNLQSSCEKICGIVIKECFHDTMYLFLWLLDFMLLRLTHQVQP